ncbi:MAG: 4-alpha-glucanotransferase [Spirochaetes bacterium]|nr:4-alpha-glucanotransferase [Spirochaetota bacterium]
MHVARSTGILLHVSSLPGPFGIGEIGDEARAFVDLLARAGIGSWQVLPLGPTGYGDSPYAAFSSFAGNELLISTDALVRENLLAPADADSLRRREGPVEYGALIPAKTAILAKAAEAFIERATPGRRAAFDRFVIGQNAWLEDYALFMAAKACFDARAETEGVSGATWCNYWPPELALRESAAMAEARDRYRRDSRRRKVLQFLFHEQWHALRDYANARSVRIIGDIPIFVAGDSADVWANRGLFALDARGTPIEVAGVPPDYFSEDGQLWGNPLYDWDAHVRQGFSWWVERIRAALALYDAVRIDHFRGFEAYWAVPNGEKTAREGVWRKAPGRALFEAVRAALGDDLPVIAEDLGLITPEVRALRDDFGLPGMKILQFGFDSSESDSGLDPWNGFLPHNYPRNCVVYTGTHDNDTTAGWLGRATVEELAFLAEYVGLGEREGWSESAEPDIPRLTRALVREALKSPANLAVIPMQDILGLGSSSRMNTPSTIGGNWTWRMRSGDFTEELAMKFGAMSALYGRGPADDAD